MATVRITGPVLRVEHREGTARATGNPYAFDEVSVLVGLRDVTSYIVRDIGDVPAVGDLVDALVDVAASNGRLNANYVAEWDETYASVLTPA